MLDKIKNITENDLNTIASYLIVGLGFFIATSVAVTNIILVLLLLLFLFERRYQERFNLVKNNPLIYIIFALVLMHVIGFLWSENLQIAGETFGRVKKLMWIPFLMMYVKKEHIIYYFQAFILGMIISEVLTYLVWFDIIPHFMHVTANSPSPLMLSTNYAPYVAMASFLLLYLLLYFKSASRWQQGISLFFLVTMLINLFITGGRAGQIGFFVLFLVLILGYFKGKVFKGLLFFSIASTILFSLAYNNIELFKLRIDMGITEATHFSPGLQKTSVGIRLALNKNYYAVFKENFLLGVGTGDYMDAYKLVNAKSEYKTMITHPHNMYMLIFVQLGMIGGMIFLTLFLYQMYYATKIEDEFRPIRIAFPLFFMAIMSVNWYLYTFNTMFLFIYFTSILYNESETQ